MCSFQLWYSLTIIKTLRVHLLSDFYSKSRNSSNIVPIQAVAFIIAHIVILKINILVYVTLINININRLLSLFN